MLHALHLYINVHECTHALQVYMQAGCMCINAEKVHSIDLKQKLNSKQEMHVWKLHAMHARIHNHACTYACIANIFLLWLKREINYKKTHALHATRNKRIRCIVTCT